MKTLSSTLLFTCVVLLNTQAAHAGLLRYDMSYRNSNDVGPPSFSGYMLFNDNAPLGRDIWGSIVDWHFGFSFSFQALLPNTLAPRLSGIRWVAQ